MSSGLWIKMRRSLSSDPDVFRIGELTALNRFAVVGKLHAVWSWADEHDVTSRDAVSVTYSYIDQRLPITKGSPKRCVRSAGWRGPMAR